MSSEDRDATPTTGEMLFRAPRRLNLLTRLERLMDRKRDFFRHTEKREEGLVRRELAV